MENWRQALRETGRILAETEKEIDSQLVSLGKYLVKKDIPAGPLDSDLAAAREEEQLLAEGSRTVEKISKAADNLTELSKEIQDREKERSELERSVNQLYEGVGLEVYQSQVVPIGEDDEVDSLMNTLDEETGRIQKMDNDILRGKESLPKRSVLKKWAQAGRSFFLSQSKTMRQRGLSRIYGELGRKTCDKLSLEMWTDELLVKLARPVLDLKEEWERVDSRLQVLEEERSKLTSRLAEWDADRPSKRLSALRTGLTEKEKAFEDLLTELGRKYLKTGAELPDRKGEQIKKRIEELEVIRGTQEDRRSKLQAALDLADLERSQGAAESRLRRIDSDLEGLKKDKQKWRENLAQIEEKKKELEKIRGPLEDLMEGQESEKSQNSK